MQKLWLTTVINLPLSNMSKTILIGIFTSHKSKGRRGQNRQRDLFHKKISGNRAASEAERSLGRLNFRRRLFKDIEKLVESSEAMLQTASITLIVNCLQSQTNKYPDSS